MSTSVAIIGAGPAGLATAIGLRLDGCDVRVYEKAPRAPIDKACGEGLMPDGVAALARLGVRLDPERSVKFRGISYVDGDLVARGRFRDGEGVGVRRTVLHEALIDRALEVGAEIHWSEKIEDPESLNADWLVGADGLHSRIRRRIQQSQRNKTRRERFGVRRHYRIAPWTDLVEIHLADDCEAYVTPVANDEIGVAILWSGRKAGFDDLAASFPRLQERLTGADVVSSDRGAGPLRQSVDVVAQDRLALVGDASGYVDALTGEGLALAFRQAEALRKAVAAGDLSDYDRDHRTLGRRARLFTEAMLFLAYRPRLRRFTVRRLSRSPSLFDAVLRLKTPSH